MKKQCNFCGRSEREVKLLITGIDGFICEDCAQQAYKIVLEQGILDKKGSKMQQKFQPNKRLPGPVYHWSGRG